MKEQNESEARLGSRKQLTAVAFALAAVVILFAASAASAGNRLEDVRAPEGTCEYEDQSGGFGGQSGTCTFSCKENQFITASATADDEDADVSVSGTCDGVTARCSGESPNTHTCSEDSLPDITGGSDLAGKCSGDSDEFIDSGFYMACGAADHPDGPPDLAWCPVQEPVPVCVDPLPPVLKRLVIRECPNLGEATIQMDSSAVFVFQQRAVPRTAEECDQSLRLVEKIDLEFEGGAPERSVHLFTYNMQPTGFSCYGNTCYESTVPPCISETRIGEENSYRVCSFSNAAQEL